MKAICCTHALKASCIYVVGLSDRMNTPRLIRNFGSQINLVRRGIESACQRRTSGFRWRTNRSVTRFHKTAFEQNQKHTCDKTKQNNKNVTKSQKHNRNRRELKMRNSQGVRLTVQRITHDRNMFTEGIVSLVRGFSCPTLLLSTAT